MGLCAQLYAEQASNSGSLEDRISHLERLMNSQKQLELLFRVKQIKQENQQLRSLVEEQSNEIHLLKQRQKDRYTDLNKRIEILEKGRDVALDSKTKTIEVIDKSVPIIKNTPKKSSKSKVVDAAAPAVEKKSVKKKKTISDTDHQAEQKAYQKAYNELIAHRYNKARDSFVRFIQHYPGRRYAHIAQYWIAEASYAQRNYEQAIIDYQLLLDRYSFSPKKAEAELKKAYSYYELADKDKAREILHSLIKNYPDTTESGQAKHLLKKL